MNKNILRKIPAILVMAGIFYMSSLPGDDPLLNSVYLSSRIKHIIAYFTLGISFCIWIPRKKWLEKPILWCLPVIALCTVFGILDEFHQSFVPGRSCEGFICFSKDMQKLNISSDNLHDIVSDLIGGTVATLVFLFFELIFPIFYSKSRNLR
jgi:VanZ family protein